MTLDFTFTDVPYLTLDNLPTAFLEGEAEISYDADGQWTINHISVFNWTAREGHRSGHTQHRVSARSIW